MVVIEGVGLKLVVVVTVMLNEVVTDRVDKVVSIAVDVESLVATAVDDVAGADRVAVEVGSGEVEKSAELVGPTWSVVVESAVEERTPVLLLVTTVSVVVIG